MVGFLKRLFGGSKDATSADVSTQAPNEVYKEIEIRANPMKDSSGQWRIAGTLTKGEGEAKIVRQFIRADLVSNRDEAVLNSVRKAKMIIDQNGQGIWQGDTNHPV